MKKICQYPGCSNVAKNKGKQTYSRWCNRHYDKSARKVEVPRICKWTDCNNAISDSGTYCFDHREAAKQRQHERQKTYPSYNTWGRKHPERKRELNRASYERNKGKHPERSKAWQEQTKARKKQLAKERHSQPCWLCGWKEAMCDFHRRVPGSEGGTYRKSNVMVLCPNCHRLAHHAPQQFREKMIWAVLHEMPLADHIPFQNPPRPT